MKNCIGLFVLLVCALVGFSNSPAMAGPVKISVASKMGPQSPEHKALERFSQLVAEKSDGELEVSLFGSSVLGNDETAFKGLNMGAVDVFVGSINIATKMYVPELDYFTPPFVYSDYDHFIRFCKSDFAKIRWEQLREKANVVMLNTEWTWRRGPFRVLCTKKPIKSVEELNGLKLRFYPSTLELNVWKSLGTSPIVIPWSETYLALQQGIVEAVTSPVTLILDSKFVEVSPYVTRVDEYPQTIAFFINQTKFNSLTVSQKKALVDACNQAGTEFTAGLDALADQILAEAKSKYGASFSVIDMAPFIAKADNYYKTARADGSMPKEFWEVLDAIEAVR